MTIQACEGIRRDTKHKCIHLHTFVTERHRQNAVLTNTNAQIHAACVCVCVCMRVNACWQVFVVCDSAYGHAGMHSYLYTRMYGVCVMTDGSNYVLSVRQRGCFCTSFPALACLFYLVAALCTLHPLFCLHLPVYTCIRRFTCPRTCTIPHRKAARLAPTFLFGALMATASSEASTCTCPDPGTAAVLPHAPTQRDWEMSWQLDGPEIFKM